MMTNEKEKQVKLKEILLCQKKINGIKKERLGLMESQGQSQGPPCQGSGSGESVEWKVGGIPVHRRSYSLDKRTTCVKVEGFPEGTTEDDLSKHFTPYGKPLKLTLHTTHALITFPTRANAERARTNGTQYLSSSPDKKDDKKTAESTTSTTTTATTILKISWHNSLKTENSSNTDSNNNNPSAGNAATTITENEEEVVKEDNTFADSMRIEGRVGEVVGYSEDEQEVASVGGGDGEGEDEDVERWR